VTSTPVPVTVEEGTTASSSGLRTAAWIVGGGALAAAGTGLAFNLAARNTTDQEAWESYRRWSVVGYVAGAALAITSGVLFWASRPAAAASSAHAHFGCAPTLAGVACQGLF